MPHDTLESSPTGPPSRQVSFGAQDYVEDAGETEDDDDDSCIEEQSPRMVVSDDVEEHNGDDLRPVDCEHIPTALRTIFSHLLREDSGGSAVYFFEEVEKRSMTSEFTRILIVADAALYLADPKTSALTRCIPFSLIQGYATEAGNNGVFALVIPTQYDVLLGFRQAHLLSSLVQVLDAMRARHQLGPMQHREVDGEDERLEAMMNLVKPPTEVAPMVKIKRRAPHVDRVDGHQARRRSIVTATAAPANRSTKSLTGARASWKASAKYNAGEEAVQYVNELENRCADLEEQLAELQEGTSLEIAQLSDELQIKDSLMSEWQKRYNLLKSRERQLERDVKRLSEESEEATSQLRESVDNTKALRQRVQMLERENAALVKERSRVCEIVTGNPNLEEQDGEHSTTTTSITEVIRQALSTTETLKDDNWRLLKQVAELQKKLGSGPRLKPESTGHDSPRMPSPPSAPDSRLDLIDALESERDSLKMAAHKSQRANEVTKLELFDLEQKHTALVTKHSDVTQAQRNTIRCLERKIGRLQIGNQPQPQFTLSDRTAKPPVPAASQTVKMGDRVLASIRGDVITGVVKFIGFTHFAAGPWVGVCLDEAVGKHNGTVHEKVYFKCPDSRGVFLREEALALELVHCVRCVSKDGRSKGALSDTVGSHARSHSAHPVPQSPQDYTDSYLHVALTLREELDAANKKLSDEKQTSNFLRASLAKASPGAKSRGKSNSSPWKPEDPEEPSLSPPLPPPSLSRLSPAPPSECDSEVV